MLERATGVAGGFKTEYEVLPVVGKDGIGDSSPKIRQGRIVRERRAPDICMSEKVRRELLESYPRFGGSSPKRA